MNYTLMTELFSFCRHPNVEERPTFCDIIQDLQKSDFHILKWSAEDKKTYSKEARRLGSSLELGKEMYKELQEAYLTTL